VVAKLNFQQLLLQSHHRILQNCFLF